jgi:hypothetical protein
MKIEYNKEDGGESELLRLVTLAATLQRSVCALPLRRSILQNEPIVILMDHIEFQ